MSVQAKELEKYLAKLLNIYDFEDYGPNGLQIEGKKAISKIAFCVSATQDSIAKAVSNKADAMITHHGLFWKFHGTKTLKGAFAKRVFPLVRNEINLFGYHLPLDAHPEIGNAASIAKELGLKDFKPFGDHKGSPTGISAKFEPAISAIELKEKLKNILSHEVLHSSPDDQQMINSIGIITGGANGDWYRCLRSNLDAYLTGEMSEHDWHESKESGIHMYAGGHNATESLGIQSLMRNISEQFKVDCFYIESENPA
jgi:dinuclear metal center YbgI/SA1388 family protein